ncbi:MAG: prepilin-type N-terminal cleavage/methylation domain-containing protein [Acidobacteriota bacterium]
MIRNRFKEDGFTLVEVLVSTLVFLIAVAIAASLVQLGSFDLRTNRSLTEVQQHARTALKFIERDVTNSGHQYLQGDAAGGVNGARISRTAFLNVTGLTNLPANPNITTPNTPANTQELFCLVPVRRRDNLGNGDTVDNGSADRLTIAYVDEFFSAGTTTTAPDPPRNLTQFRGTWNSGSQFYTLLPDSSGATTIVYSLARVRPGDIMMLSFVGENPVLVMVTQVDAANRRIQFQSNDPLGFNQINSPMRNRNDLNAENQALLYPLERIPVPTPTEPNIITATRVNVFTYLVDNTSRELLRRTYTTTTPSGFVNDPVCQNVERLWFSYNRVVPSAGGTPPPPPTFSGEIEIDINNNTAELLTLQRIRRVNVNLIVRSTEIDRRSKLPARYNLQGSFMPRNVAYSANQNIR